MVRMYKWFYVVCFIFVYVVPMYPQKVQKCTNGKYGIYDNNRSKWTIDPHYSSIKIINNAIFASEDGVIYGILDNEGKWQVKPNYTHIEAIKNDFFIKRTNGNCELINKNGEILYNINGDYHYLLYKDFKTACKLYVEKAINIWQQKGEFEKISNWRERVNIETRKEKIEKLVTEARDIYLFINRDNPLSLNLERYDAENEVFLVSSDKFGDFLVSVPIIEAPSFKEAWDFIKINPQYCLTGGLLDVEKITFKLPNGKEYTYNNNNLLNYTITDIDYTFAPIEINLSQEQINDQQNISKVILSAGLSDVDTNIPVEASQNANTFVVIIANENYVKLSKVPYAMNDGEIFGEYCKSTLGIPNTNIRFYKDATYGTMLAAINDIRDIARVFQGNINVIFYYAGHGASEEDTNDAFLMPIDAFAVKKEICYSLSKLYLDFYKLDANKVVLFIDACFSGATRDGKTLASARGIVVTPKSEIPHGKVLVLSASTADQTALPYEEQNHGLFTYFLLKKLKESKGNATMGELDEYIKRNVSRQSIVVNRKLQTPSTLFSKEIDSLWKEWRLK